MNYFEKIKKAEVSPETSQFIASGIKLFDDLLDGKGIPPEKMLLAYARSPARGGHLLGIDFLLNREVTRPFENAVVAPEVFDVFANTGDGDKNKVKNDVFLDAVQ